MFIIRFVQVIKVVKCDLQQWGIVLFNCCKDIIIDDDKAVLQLN